MTLPRVTVVGAGPAGCVAAAALARTGFPVRLVAPPPARWPKPGENLPAQCRPLLERAGIFERFASDDSTAWRAPVSEQFWGERSPRHGAVSGWHIDRQKFEEILLEKALADGVELITDSLVEHVELTANGCGCTLRKGDGIRACVEADFLIDATGRRALIARACGARIHATDELIAWQGLWEESSAASRALMIEAQANGWSYLVPLPGGKVSAGFVTDRDSERSLASTAQPGVPRAVEMLRAMGPSVQARLVNCRCLRGLVRWKAHSSITTPPFGSRWLAVGDAATTFDPLAACGMLFALGSAFYAAHAIREKYMQGDPSAFFAYTWALSRFCAAVRGKLEDTYASETRWPDSPFWARRQTGKPAAVAPDEDFFRPLSQHQTY